MDIEAADKNRKKPKTTDQKNKEKKEIHKKHDSHKQGKNGKHGHRSKSKKKSGLMCCRKKEKGGRSSKSGTRKKQPKNPVIEPLASVPNEQLGDVVLVKNRKLPESPPKLEKAESENSKPQIEKVAELSKEKVASEKNDKDEKPEKPKDDASASGKRAIGKEEKMNEKRKKNNCEPTFKASKQEVEQWKALAEKILKEDEKVAAKYFAQVSSYLPSDVTKTNFVCNMPKNRFSDVICLDHSRVQFSGSSYIHANWVDIGGLKKVILTQLPLSDTASDFWQMIIEKRVKCVLLILTDEEYNQFGGDCVFPVNQDFLNFEENSIRVGEFKQLEMAKGWCLKVLSITNGSYKSFVHVHHYKNWVHGTAPSDAQQIWRLQSYVNKYIEPPVFMSLSGCGRAGTYALLDTAYTCIQSDKPSFDMVKCLEIVRNGRVHAVQNLCQFSFVCNLMADHILGNISNGTKIDEDQESSLKLVLKQLNNN